MELVKQVEGEILPHAITAYNPFRAKIAEMQEVNAKTIFQYNTPKGNTEARSYIYKLRQSKAEVERVRKAEKAASLEYGRKVDSEAKMIVDEIDAMIEVHQKPLDEIEAKEKARVAAIQESIDVIKKFQECAGNTSEEIRNALDVLNSIDVDASYEEFQIEAEKQKAIALANQQAELLVAEKREAEAAELERLRKEAAEREQKEREERIATEAAKRAKKEAEEKAANDARIAKEKADAEAKAAEEAARKREQAERDAKEKAERELKEANERAEKAAQAERDKIAKEAADKAAEDAKRAANEAHVKAINENIVFAIKDLLGIDAVELVESISQGHIANLSIQY